MSIQDFTDIFKSLPPHWLALVLGLFVFGLYWKKSAWPNRYYGSINLALGVVVYTMLEIGTSDEPFHLYRQPYFILPIYGFAAAMVALVGHNLIISFLKSKFPSIQWPEDEPANPPPPAAPVAPVPKP